MAELIAYASRTGTRRNLDAMREVNRTNGADVWRMLVSRVGVWRSEGFRYCLDSGAWSDFQQGQPFDDDGYERLIEAMGARADWVLLPDIVAGGQRSLDLSMRWMNRARSISDLVLIAVQDGMALSDLAPLVGPHVGIFLGGSTAWKLRTMRAWGVACAEWGCWYHVARVNTERRFRLAHDAGATSVDGSSATRFAKTLPLLERARRQPSLIAPFRALPSIL